MQALKDFFLSWIDQWGNLGVFLFSYTESIIQPFPVDPILIAGVAAGSNPHTLLFYASAGALLGAITAYFLGKYLGEPIFLKLFKKKYYEQGEKFFEKYGIYAVLLGAVTPIPFKVIAWLAGIFEMPFGQFMLMTFIGRVGRFALVVYATNLFI
ncbi:DedA family protein [Candidatus Peregrinibacteria bacterium]|jgi:membrane protein YqaA with SNARE-associated domain|nr:DedA family protein [Candidatus Peregrinibacteria bacterium]